MIKLEIKFRTWPYYVKEAGALSSFLELGFTPYAYDGCSGYFSQKLTNKRIVRIIWDSGQPTGEDVMYGPSIQFSKQYTYDSVDRAIRELGRIERLFLSKIQNPLSYTIIKANVVVVAEH